MTIITTATTAFLGAWIWCSFLRVRFTMIEFIGGLLTNSTAIQADALYDLGGSLSVGIA